MPEFSDEAKAAARETKKNIRSRFPGLDAEKGAKMTTTAEVRYRFTSEDAWGFAPEVANGTAGEEFDRWLEGVKRQAKIEALREAADELSGEGFIFRTNNGVGWMAIDTLKSAAKVLYHDARKLQEEES